MERSNFFENHKADDPSDSRFHLETNRLLSVRVDSPLIAKAGSMVASKGDISFVGQMSPEDGIGGVIKEISTSESPSVMEVSGDGRAYLADNSKKVQIISLPEGASMIVSGDEVLAFEEKIDYSIKTIDSLSGMASDGLTNVELTGPGTIAITTYGNPLSVEPPVDTDPKSTVAWTGNLTPKIKINKSLTDFIGQSSGERYQMRFTGEEGQIIVSPTEK